MLNNPAVGVKAKRLVARCTELRSYIETNEGALMDHTVKLPRWPRLASYAAQFVTRRACLGT